MNISPLTAGTMTWGHWGADYAPADMARLIAHCIERGVTTFDHADIYGHYTTEETFGVALEQLGTAARADVQLVTKCGIGLVTKNRPENRVKHYDSSRAHILASVDRSLENLRTDYIDLLLIHRPDFLMRPEEVAAAFEILLTTGKVKHFGVSNFSPSQFELLNSYVPLETNQIEFHPLHVDPLFDGTLDQLVAKKTQPMIWSPLGGQKYFAGESTSVLRLRDEVKHVAEKHGGVTESVILLAWLLRHPSRPLPVLGTTKAGRIDESLRALSIELDRQDWYAILEAGRGHEVA